MFICVTCGVDYPTSERPPAECPVCEDFRQYVGHDGQQWTTLPDLSRTHRNVFTELSPGIHSIHTEPNFAIGQRALLVRSGDRNILWDCVSLIDPATIAHIRQLGGIAAIAISHPHYYSTMIEWSEAFGNIPIYLHEADRKWVMHAGHQIEFWQRETYPLTGDATLIRCGGHFEGGQVMHHRDGALFTGDVIQVVPDRRWVSFMRSYPNYIPLPASSVNRIVGALGSFTFDRLYGAFPQLEISTGAKAAVERSAARYLRALKEEIEA